MKTIDNKISRMIVCLFFATLLFQETNANNTLLIESEWSLIRSTDNRNPYSIGQDDLLIYRPSAGEDEHNSFDQEEPRPGLRSAPPGLDGDPLGTVPAGEISMISLLTFAGLYISLKKIRQARKKVH